MRTLRVTLAATLMLALLGGLGGAALAQEEEDGNGGFTLKFVAGTDTWNDGTFEGAEGFDEVTGRGESMDMEASDPRLSGTWTKEVNCREGGPPLFMVCAGKVRVENEGGTWFGTMQQSGATFGHPGPHWAHWTVLEGQGEYTGLTAIVDYDEERMGEGDINGVGIIFDFGMPPMPETVE